MDIPDDQGNIKKEERHYAHIFAMVATTTDVIDSLVADLKDENAFKNVHTETGAFAFEQGRGWR